MRSLDEQIEINAPASFVWEVLADFGGVANWAPYMRTCHLIGDQAQGVGTRRGMRHAWGFRFEEAVTEWRDGEGLSFDVLRAPFPMSDVRESWRVSGSGGCAMVSTKVTYGMRLGAVGSALDQLLVHLIVRREMRAGLRGLKRYAEDRSRLATSAPAD